MFEWNVIEVYFNINFIYDLWLFLMFYLCFIVLWVLGLLICSVINFELVYDFDGSMIIDFYFDEEGNLINDLDDFIW